MKGASSSPCVFDCDLVISKLKLDFILVSLGRDGRRLVLPNAYMEEDLGIYTTCMETSIPSEPNDKSM